jgi:hypothetical protein
MLLNTTRRTQVMKNVYILGIAKLKIILQLKSQGGLLTHRPSNASRERNKRVDDG